MLLLTLSSRLNSMSTDWKTRLLALHANTVISGNFMNRRISPLNEFKDKFSTEQNPVCIARWNNILQENCKPEIYIKFMRSSIAKDMQSYNIPMAHVLWIMDTIKKLTVAERRQFLKVLSTSYKDIKPEARTTASLSPPNVTSMLISSKYWKEYYNALRDFVYPKNRNTTTQAQ